MRWAEKQEALGRNVPRTICDHVYFTRALLGLYESRHRLESTREVLAVAPKSTLASSASSGYSCSRSRPPVEQSWFQSVMAAPAIRRVK